MRSSVTMAFWKTSFIQCFLTAWQNQSFRVHQTFKEASCLFCTSPTLHQWFVAGQCYCQCSQAAAVPTGLSPACWKQQRQGNYLSSSPRVSVINVCFFSHFGRDNDFICSEQDVKGRGSWLIIFVFYQLTKVTVVMLKSYVVSSDRRMQSFS